MGNAYDGPADMFRADRIRATGMLGCSKFFGRVVHEAFVDHQNKYNNNNYLISPDLSSSSSSSSSSGGRSSNTMQEVQQQHLGRPSWPPRPLRVADVGAHYGGCGLWPACGLPASIVDIYEPVAEYR